MRRGFLRGGLAEYRRGCKTSGPRRCVIGEGLAAVTGLFARRKAQGWPLQVVTTTRVVCRETDAEVEAYYQYYAVDNADTAAVDYHMNMARGNRQVDTARSFSERKRYAAGLGSHRLIGSPARIVDEPARLSWIGIDGVTLSFVNFKDERPLFIDRVLPLLRQAGLRKS